MSTAFRQKENEKKQSLEMVISQMEFAFRINRNELFRKRAVFTISLIW